MQIQVDISLYPLREPDLAPPIFDFVQRLERAGLEVEIGPMSSVVSGDGEAVFNAIREAYEGSAANGTRVMVLKVINPKTH